MAIDANWSSVVLHLPMDGTNGSPSIVDVKSGKIPTITGNTQISTAQSLTGGSSCYFDGTGDRLTYAASSDWDLSGGNFAIEFSVYPTVNVTGATCRLFLIGTNGTASAFYVGISSTMKVQCYVPSGSPTGLASADNVVVANTWNRFEISVSAGTGRIFKDGVLVAGPTAITLPTTSSSNPLYIGYDTVATVNFNYQGYLDRVRFTNGAPRHTAAFTSDDDPFPRPTISGTVYDDVGAKAAKTVLVTDRSSHAYVGGANSDPTTGAYVFYPPDFGEYSVRRIDELADPYWNDIVLAARLTGTDGGTSFPTLTGHTLTKTGTVTTTTTTPATNPFGTGSSALFTGAGSHLSTGSLAAMLLGTTYTISGWFYVTTIDATRTGLIFVGDVNSNSNRTSIGIYSDGRIEFYAESSSAIFTVQSSAGLITTSTWFHFAAVRYGPNALLFVNGSLVGSAVASGTEPTGNNFFIGASRASSAVRGLIGNMYDVKFSRRAEYLGNFTTPTSPFLIGPADGGSGENALIYDRVIPG